MKFAVFLGSTGNQYIPAMENNLHEAMLKDEGTRGGHEKKKMLPDFSTCTTVAVNREALFGFA